MLHVVDISYEEYNDLVYGYKRFCILDQKIDLKKNDYIVFQYHKNSVIFFVNDALEDMVKDNHVLCSLIPCSIELQEPVSVSSIENDEPFENIDDIDDLLPFS